MRTEIKVLVDIQADKPVDWENVQVFLVTLQGNVFIRQIGDIKVEEDQNR